MELVVVIAVILIVVGSLTFATIASLRNAQFAKNQAQATKLAQEGLEKVRSIRDRDPSSMGILWTTSTLSCASGICYFYFDESNELANDGVEIIEPDFRRQFIVEDMAMDQKKVTSVVKWTDFSGEHESRLTTILRKL